MRELHKLAFLVSMNAILFKCISVEHIGERKDPLEYFFVEELPPGSALGNIAVDALITAKYNETIRSKLRYYFVNEDSNMHLLDVNEKTGIISTTERIDRDSICLGSSDCVIWLNVGVLPEQYSETIRIRVEILDINDHNPKFPKDQMSIQIPETTAPGKSWILPYATDEDSEQFSVKSYELHYINQYENKGPFELKIGGSSDGKEEVRIVLSEKLDREKSSSYKLEIVAIDGGDGDSVKTGSLNVDITVQDVNDNDPSCDNATYEFFVLENVPAGTTIGQIKAKDRDFGANGQIEYIFSEGTMTRYGNLFGITNSSGMIYQKKALDFEAGSTYLLEVTARDHGDNSRPGHCTVIVRVEDQNDNDPEIKLGGISDSNKAFMAKSAKPGTTVAQITVSDQDGGDNGKVECTLTHDYFQMNEVHQTSYKIVTKLLLSGREAKDIFRLRVVCHDMGNPPKFAMEEIEVHIVKENNRPPVFDQYEYKVHIKENNEVGIPIVKVHASDPDLGLFGEVRYSLINNSDKLFQINQDTGEIITNVVWDHEMTRLYIFEVMAYDLGVPSNSAIAVVKLNIIDMRDDVLTFSEPSYEFGVFENAPVHSEVGSVVVKGETSEHYHFSFDYTDGSDAENFYINTLSGKILTKRPLDREERTVYYLSVITKNSEQIPLSGSVSVKVYIADKNDNAPTILFPNVFNNTVYISASKTKIGDIVTKVEATDLDIGSNGKLTYTFNNGNTDNTFSIDHHTAEVMLMKKLNVNQNGRFDLKVEVKDHGSPQYGAMAQLIIVIKESPAYTKKLISNSEKTVVAKDATAVVSVTAAFLIIVFLVLFTIMMFLVWRRYKTNLAKNNGNQFYYPSSGAEFRDMERDMQIREISSNERNTESVERNLEQESEPSLDNITNGNLSRKNSVKFSNIHDSNNACNVNSFKNNDSPLSMKTMNNNLAVVVPTAVVAPSVVGHPVDHQHRTPQNHHNASYPPVQQVGPSTYRANPQNFTRNSRGSPPTQIQYPVSPQMQHQLYNNPNDWRPFSNRNIRQNEPIIRF